MAKDGFLKRHGIVRNAIKEDLIFFAGPWIIAMSVGLMLSAWDLVKSQDSLLVLSVQSVIGLALLATGLTIQLVSQITLGRLYSSTLVIKEGHQLITHGIYRFVRHPIYLGVLVGFYGITVYASSLYGFLVTSLQIPIFLNRIRLEEKLLTEEFQDSHQRYKETTRKLIPFIY